MSLSEIVSTLGELAYVFGEKEGKFSEEIGDAFFDYMTEIVGEIHGEMCELARCESPIEQQFFVEWLKDYDNRSPGIWRLYPQKRYNIKEKHYRVDFLATLSNRYELFHGNWDKTEHKSVEVIVECDGHNFHEKTKEQAKSDKTRDRALQSTGTPVLHFTGSEIYNDACKCVREVVDLLWNNLKELTDG